VLVDPGAGGTLCTTMRSGQMKGQNTSPLGRSTLHTVKLLVSMSLATAMDVRSRLGHGKEVEQATWVGL
jgi:hypothetical protein